MSPITTSKRKCPTVYWSSMYSNKQSWLIELLSVFIIEARCPWCSSSSSSLLSFHFFFLAGTVHGTVYTAPKHSKFPSSPFLQHLHKSSKTLTHHMSYVKIFPQIVVQMKEVDPFWCLGTPNIFLWATYITWATQCLIIGAKIKLSMPIQPPPHSTRALWPRDIRVQDIKGVYWLQFLVIKIPIKPDIFFYKSLLNLTFQRAYYFYSIKSYETQY